MRKLVSKKEHRLKNPRIVCGCFLIILSAVLCLVCLKDRPAGSAHSFASGGRSRSFDLPVLPQGTLRINEAETDELIQLPGIGETLAQAILDERSVHGSFYYPEDLLAIKGIGPYRLERIVPFLDLR